jgi:hypothetical protein
VARKNSSGTDGAPQAKGGAPSPRAPAESSAPGHHALDEALDALYAAPFDSFVAERREAASRLRAAGDIAAARSIAAAAKPTRTAWALNQVARGRPELVTSVVDAREAAAKVQKSGDAHAIREGARAFRDAVGEVVRAARSVLDEAGAPLNAAQARRMAETLQALATDDAEREKLAAGRLTHDVAVEDPFAGLEPGAHRERAAASHHPSRSEVPDAPEAGKRAPVVAAPAPARARAEAAELRAQRAAEEAARKREAEEHAAREKQRAIDEARARLEDAERAAQGARDVADAAERALARAREQADGARRALTKAESDLERARFMAKKVGA